MMRALLPGLLLAALLFPTAGARANPLDAVRRVSTMRLKPSAGNDGTLTVDTSSTLGHLKFTIKILTGFNFDPLRAFKGGTNVFDVIASQFSADILFCMGFSDYFDICAHPAIGLFQSSCGNPVSISGTLPPLKGTSLGDFRIIPRITLFSKRHKLGLIFRRARERFTSSRKVLRLSWEKFRAAKRKAGHYQRRAEALEKSHRKYLEKFKSYQQKLGGKGGEAARQLETYRGQLAGYREKLEAARREAARHREAADRLKSAHGQYEKRYRESGENYEAVSKRYKNQHGLGIGFMPEFTMPTGGKSDNTGEQAWTFSPKVVLDYRFKQGALLALNMGVRLRKQVYAANLSAGSEFFFDIGAEIPLYRRQLSALLELHGAVGFTDSPDDPDPGIDSEEVYLEGMVGMRYRFCSGFYISGGVGKGLTKGWGAPKYRLFFDVGFGPRPHCPARDLMKDSDGDGIRDPLDRCPFQPEDLDGYQDQDGCPDPDNDGDGVCDDNPAIHANLADHAKVCKGRDLCTNEAEDQDGFQDQDGKPDPDNDGDGICDNNPVIQANLARYGKICKGRDLCPNEAEDKDGFQDDDGCPDPDNDGDGICDNNPVIQANLARYGKICKGKDLCPNKPEVFNQYQDGDGCPDVAPRKKVVIIRKKIVIREKIIFGTNTARIMKVSHRLLKGVHKIIKDNPWVKLVRIVGHTDYRGPRKRNLRLSKQRAEAVKAFLVKRGLPAQKLLPDGRGEEEPIQRGCSRLHTWKKVRACWRKNRRVEFKIEYDDPKKKEGTK